MYRPVKASAQYMTAGQRVVDPYKALLDAIVDQGRKSLSDPVVARVFGRNIEYLREQDWRSALEMLTELAELWENRTLAERMADIWDRRAKVLAKLRTLTRKNGAAYMHRAYPITPGIRRGLAGSAATNMRYISVQFIAFPEDPKCLGELKPRPEKPAGKSNASATRASAN